MVEVRLQCCAQPCDRAHQKTDVGLRGLQSTAERALCSSIHSKANRSSVGPRHVGELPLVCFSCLPVCAHVEPPCVCPCVEPPCVCPCVEPPCVSMCGASLCVLMCGVSLCVLMCGEHLLACLFCSICFHLSYLGWEGRGCSFTPMWEGGGCNFTPMWEGGGCSFTPMHVMCIDELSMLMAPHHVCMYVCEWPCGYMAYWWVALLLPMEGSTRNAVLPNIRRNLFVWTTAPFPITTS